MDLESDLKPGVSCPKCAGNPAMQRTRIGPIEIDRCPRCAGLWLDETERERLTRTKDSIAQLKAIDKEASRSAQQRQDARRNILCPRDHTPLAPVQDPVQPHVDFERCERCGGIFLDAGELRDLSEHTLLERLGLARG